MDFKCFVALLLADLASKSPITYFDEREIKTTCLNTRYKEIIENIMYQENGWGITFAELINIHSYYESQSDWEREFGTKLNEFVTKMGKEVKYNFITDNIEIDFTEKEINTIKGLFDEETLKNIDHFTTLINDPEFNRKQVLEKKEIARGISRWKHKIKRGL